MVAAAGTLNDAPMETTCCLVLCIEHQEDDSQVSLVAAFLEDFAKKWCLAELLLSGEKAQGAQEVCNRYHKCTEVEQCLIADGSDLPSSISTPAT